ncbi:NAD(P)-binding protein [Sarocladium strictum]
MTEAKPQLLLLGATGYIGGVLLSKWHATSFETLSFQVTAASRSTERLAKVEKLLGISTVCLSFDDTDRLEEQVKKYDIVVQLADCDAFEATHAILRGMKARHEATGTRPLLYHASGAGEAGPDEEVLSDLDGGMIARLPVSLPHRNVDDAILAADKAGYLRAYIVVPFAVFGQAEGIMHEHGIANPSSMPIPRLIAISKQLKTVPQFGQGRNQKAWVHVEDVANLFEILLQRAPPDHGINGFYFCENGEIGNHLVTEALASEFFTLGIFPHEKAVALPEAKLEDGKLRYWACTERGRSERSRSLGWQPKHDLSGLLQYVRDEVKRLG